MTGQKKACPCANTDKPTMKRLQLQYTTESVPLQYVGISYIAVDDRGHKYPATATLRLCSVQAGDLIHWLHYHLKGSNPPPALYHLEMLLQSLEYLRGGREYLYNSICDIQYLESPL